MEPEAPDIPALAQTSHTTRIGNKCCLFLTGSDDADGGEDSADKEEGDGRDDH